MLELLCPTFSSVTSVVGQNIPSARSCVTPETVRALQGGQGCHSEGFKQSGRMGQQGLCDSRDWQSCTLDGVAILGAAGQVEKRTSAEKDWRVLRGRNVSKQCVLVTLKARC